MFTLICSHGKSRYEQTNFKQEISTKKSTGRFQRICCSYQSVQKHLSKQFSPRNQIHANLDFGTKFSFMSFFGRRDVACVSENLLLFSTQQTGLPTVLMYEFLTAKGHFWRRSTAQRRVSIIYMCQIRKREFMFLGVARNCDDVCFSDRWFVTRKVLRL